MFSKTTNILLILTFLLILSCKEEEKVTQEVAPLEKKEAHDDYNIKKDETIRYSVSMGVMPDLNYTGKGMLIGHVNSERAAQKAGVLKGDIMLEMDGKEITDLAGYTRQLGSYKKGDQVKIVVKRGDQLMEMQVEF